MSAKKGKSVGGLRIMSALVAKDITDAFKNRDMLRVILSVSFLMIFFRVMLLLSKPFRRLLHSKNYILLFFSFPLVLNL